MAQFSLQPSMAGKKSCIRRPVLKIDMTPMVDLGFLLITFFIFTTTLTDHKASDLFIPAEGSFSKTPESATLSVLLGNHNKVYVYEGKWEDAIAAQKIWSTNFSVYNGLGSFIRAKQKWLQQHNKEGKKALMLLIKPAATSSYKNLIDVLDEVQINDVKRYALMQPTDEEAAYLSGS